MAAVRLATPSIRAMRYLPFVLAGTLLQQGQPFAPPSMRPQAVTCAESKRADDNTDEIDADEAARIEEMRKRMEGMFSGAEAEAAPAAEDAPATGAAAAPKPPRLGRGDAALDAAEAARAVTRPRTRSRSRDGRCGAAATSSQERRRNDDNIPAPR